MDRPGPSLLPDRPTPATPSSGCHRPAGLERPAVRPAGRFLRLQRTVRTLHWRDQVPPRSSPMSPMSPTWIRLSGPMEISSTSRGVPMPEGETRATVLPGGRPRRRCTGHGRGSCVVASAGGDVRGLLLDGRPIPLRGWTRGPCRTRTAGHQLGKPGLYGVDRLADLLRSGVMT